MKYYSVCYHAPVNGEPFIAGHRGLICKEEDLSICIEALELRLRQEFRSELMFEIVLPPDGVKEITKEQYYKEFPDL